jgi:hypothetical protein
MIGFGIPAFFGKPLILGAPRIVGYPATVFSGFFRAVPVGTVLVAPFAAI